MLFAYRTKFRSAHIVHKNANLFQTVLPGVSIRYLILKFISLETGTRFKRTFDKNIGRAKKRAESTYNPERANMLCPSVCLFVF